MKRCKNCKTKPIISRSLTFLTNKEVDDKYSCMCPTCGFGTFETSCNSKRMAKKIWKKINGKKV